MKSEVYSWRVSSELKSDLERVARRRRRPVSSLLDEAVRDWLSRNAEDISVDEEQKRLHAVAERYFGIIKGKDSRRSERVSALVRKRLRARYDR